jgi:hypothetical protein
VLDVGQFVSRREHEIPRMGADLLIFAGGQLDNRIAAQTRAFAPKPSRRIVFARVVAAGDSLVDLAKRRLIGSDPFFQLTVDLSVQSSHAVQM